VLYSLVASYVFDSGIYTMVSYFPHAGVALKIDLIEWSRASTTIAKVHKKCPDASCIPAPGSLPSGVYRALVRLRLGF